MGLTVIDTGTTTITATADGERWLIGSWADLVVDAAPGFDLGGFNDVTFEVSGLVQGTTGIETQDTAAGFRLEINADGAVAGDVGVHLAAAGSQLMNDGKITGENKGLLIEGTTAGSTFVNAGVVSSGRHGVHVGGTDHSIVNIGTLSGSWWGLVFEAGSAGSTVVNSGTITGVRGGVKWLADDADGGSVINNGVLKVTKFDIAFEGNDMANVLVNTGKIAGDIMLGDGDDLLDGGTGTVVGRIDAGLGDDKVLSGKANDTVLGDSGNDLLVLGNGADVGRGGSGDDILRGGGGGDKLQGNDGDDLLRGGKGNDLVNGGSGDDILVGGRGKDRLVGGTGEDLFVFGDKPGNDVVLDYEDGVDTIDLTGLGIVSYAVLARAMSTKHGDAFIDLDKLGGDGQIKVLDAAGDLDVTDFLL